VRSLAQSSSMDTLDRGFRHGRFFNAGAAGFRRWRLVVREPAGTPPPPATIYDRWWHAPAGADAQQADGKTAQRARSKAPGHSAR
jgi:hypothetical protein